MRLFKCRTPPTARWPTREVPHPIRRAPTARRGVARSNISDSNPTRSPRMNIRPIHAALAAAVAALALGGCDRDETRTAKAKTKQAIDKAAAKTEGALETAGEKAKQLGAQIEKSAEEAAITAKVKGELLKDRELS